MTTSTRSTRHIPVPAAARPAWDRLVFALLELDAVPCVGADWERWTSENARVRAAAVVDCLGCPALAECRTYSTAAHEQFGVWAAVDRTPRPRKPRHRQRKATPWQG